MKQIDLQNQDLESWYNFRGGRTRPDSRNSPDLFGSKPDPT
jgi:hypothetical protein